MISRSLSKLMRFIVNNLMPILESPRVPPWRAPKLLEVHLPQFGNSSSTCNVLFRVEKKHSKDPEASFHILSLTFCASKQVKPKLVIHAGKIGK